MKQILQNFNSGELHVMDVPIPIVQHGGVLVRTHYSLISSGTEGSTVRLAKKNLLEKARSRPDLVKKVLNVARTDGAMAAYEAVANNLDAPVPLGYSLAGEVVEVGSGVDDLQIGDRVACFGSMIANHAEYNFIPRNMCALMPDDLEMNQAAFNMLGAIALNGVRRANIELGSTVLVIGLGLIGQITVQLLAASGCHVFGIDLDESKLELAKESGASHALLRSAPELEEKIQAFSDGIGVDATIITAASPSADPVELAGRATRGRGRVVALGRVPYELPRDSYLFKEIEFTTTFAFGPGVNDPDYEVKGKDYPAAFVRWSGNRNVSAFVKQAASGRLKLDKLITHEFDVDKASDAFDLVSGKNSEPSLGILLRYPTNTPYERVNIQLNSRKTVKSSNKPAVGVIGAGSHAASYLLNAIAEQNVTLRGIASAKGARSRWYGDKYEFEYAAPDPEELFKDDAIDAVFILSRHDSHAPLTTKALQAGKHVFVEKPLCLYPEELDAIIEAQQSRGAHLFVGYNRRYAALGQQLYGRFANRAQPLSITYRMNVGVRPANHWLHDADIGGGLILGEAVHFIDFVQYMVNARPVRVYAQAVHSGAGDIIDSDSVMISVSFEDGSIAQVHYNSNGDKSFGRERIEVFADNTIAVLEDWQRLTVSKDGNQDKERHLIRQDKGFSTEVSHFVQTITGQIETTMPTQHIFDGMRIAFAALESIRTQQAVNL